MPSLSKGSRKKLGDIINLKNLQRVFGYYSLRRLYDQYLTRSTRTKWTSSEKQAASESDNHAAPNSPLYNFLLQDILTQRDQNHYSVASDRRLGATNGGATKPNAPSISEYSGRSENTPHPERRWTFEANDHLPTGQACSVAGKAERTIRLPELCHLPLSLENDYPECIVEEEESLRWLQHNLRNSNSPETTTSCALDWCSNTEYLYDSRYKALILESDFGEEESHLNYSSLIGNRAPLRGVPGDQDFSQSLAWVHSGISQADSSLMLRYRASQDSSGIRRVLADEASSLDVVHSTSSVGGQLAQVEWEKMCPSVTRFAYDIATERHDELIKRSNVLRVKFKKQKCTVVDLQEEQ
ncbi:MAG: hypothetical protein M1837_003180 [Sclerophora amabilis]|nr:MAG: hypothetical protein M1837_003180 [Sclerophora amabilis]